MSFEQTEEIFEPYVKAYHNPYDPSWDNNPFETKRAKISYAYNMLAFDGSLSFTSSLPDGASNVIAIGDKYFSRSESPQAYHRYNSLFDPQNNEIYGERRPTFADTGWYDVMPITDPATGITHPSVPGKTFQVKPRPEEIDPHILQATFRAGLTISMCDGSVRTLSPGIAETAYWALITPNAGDVP
jgi:hypothetical protein